MNSSWNDVSMWIVILVLFWGFFLAGLKARDYWHDRIGYDPLKPWRRS